MLCLEWLQPPLAHAGPTIPMGYAADAPTATRVTLAVALGLQGSGSHFPEYPVLGHARPDLRAVCSEQGGSVQMCLPGNSLALQLGGVYLFILPKGPVGFAVALFVFSPCRYPKAELRTYQSISVVKHDLSAGRAAGISQVGVGVVDGESTQTWQGDRDTAEAVSGGRTARGTAGGGVVQALAHSGSGAGQRWEHLGRGDICWYGTELCPATLPEHREHRAGFSARSGPSPCVISLEKAGTGA